MEKQILHISPEFFYEDFSHELKDVDKKIFVIFMKMLNDKTITIPDMGKYQIDLMCATIVNKFTVTNIVKTTGKKISSMTLYNYFIEWMKQYNIDNELIEYFSCITFTKYFGKNYEQTRSNSGKFWKDISLKNNGKSNIINGQLISLTAFGRGSLLMCEVQKKYNSGKIRFFDETAKLGTDVLLNSDGIIGKPVIGYLQYSFEECEKTFFLNNWKNGDVYKPIELVITGKMKDIHKLQSLRIYEIMHDTEYETVYNEKYCHDVNKLLQSSRIYEIMDDAKNNEKCCQDNESSNCKRPTEIGSLPIDLLLMLPSTKIIMNKGVSTCYIDLSFMPYFYSSRFTSKCLIIEKNDDELFENLTIKLVTETVLLDASPRKNIHTNRHYQLTYCIEKQSRFTIIPHSNIAVFELSIDSDTYVHNNDLLSRLIKGYFIKCNDINDIANITLYLNEHEYLDYDELMINVTCHRISHNLLYIPFDIKKQYNDYGLSSFSTYIDHARIGNLQMKIKFHDIKKAHGTIIYDNAGCIIYTTHY